MLDPIITRITLFKFADEHCTDEVRTAARARLREAVDAIPETVFVRVGHPSDAASLRSWDMALVAAFEDQPTADRVMAGDAWRDAVLTDIGALAEVTKGWSFELGK